MLMFHISTANKSRVGPLTLDEVTALEGYLTISYHISLHVTLHFSLNVWPGEGGLCVCFQ
jgi:hypothetical protein